MQNKLQELTQKIYTEGVEEGKAKAGQLVQEAEGRSQELLAKAKADAEVIIAQAKKQADELKTKIESEIRLSGKQAIGAVKQQIQELITAKTSDQQVAAAVNDAGNLKTIIQTLVSNWASSSSEAPQLEVLLPQAQQAELESSLKAQIQDLLSKGLSLSFTKGIKGGLQIGPKDGTYLISLTDEDFMELFRQYLKPKTRAFLFND